MKPIRRSFPFLFGAILASSWWAWAWFKDVVTDRTFALIPFVTTAWCAACIINFVIANWDSEINGRVVKKIFQFLFGGGFSSAWWGASLFDAPGLGFFCMSLAIFVGVIIVLYIEQNWNNENAG